MEEHRSIHERHGDGEQFLVDLLRGQLRWDLLTPFPEQSVAEQQAGDRIVEEMSALFRGTVDPEAVDATGRLPDGFISELHPRGYLALNLAPQDGGLGLSAYNAFRAMAAAMCWSISATYVVAIPNAQGIPAILPALPAGPLRDLMCERLAAGAISGFADTEPTGAANKLPTTTATAVDDGRAYLLNGRKVFIGNGSIADEMIVSATVRTQDQANSCLFLVDTSTTGYHVEHLHDLVSFRGLPLAGLRLQDVRVPAERMITRPEDHWRVIPLLEPIAALGKLYVISGAALAAGRLCLEWSKEFVNRRLVDGQPLGEHEEIQRRLAVSLADVFAMESVVQWCMLGDDAANLRNRHLERVAAKNIHSVTAWRLVDRTISLLAAEGLETAGSKIRRGAGPWPLERFFRDIRGLRVAGAVDFHLDQRTAESFLSEFYYRSPADPSDFDHVARDLRQLPDVTLSERNRGHLRCVVEKAHAFAVACRALVRRYPAPQELFAREGTLIKLNRVAAELFTMCVVLARASTLQAKGHAEAQVLADVYCTTARERLVGLEHGLAADDEPDYAELSSAWLHGDELSFMAVEGIARSELKGRQHRR